MKEIKRFFVLILSLLLVIPIALADISISLPEKEFYNLGEKISPSVSVKEDQYYDGFFNMGIFCEDYELQYYMIPLNLEADLRTQVTVPGLPLAASMAGECRLKSSFESSDREVIDSAWSEYFFVTDVLNITIDADLEAKPGEDVFVSGKVRKYNNEILGGGEAKISFRGEENKVDVVSGDFEHTIHLSDNAETGDIPILITVTDKFGNYGDKVLSLEVIPIPTRIENKIENNVLMPGDTLKSRVVLYDHNGKAIDEIKVNVKIFDPNEELLAEKDIQSLNYFEFKTEKSQIPGSYFLLSTFEDIKEQSSFKIETVRKIIMNQEGNFVYVENAGNVDYNDEITVILESDDNKYLINKKINLRAAEKITIDLSKEVPQGVYDIILPEELAAVESETTQDAEQNIIEGVAIDDNRNVIRKTADGMSSITGAVAGMAGYVASRPALAASILVLIILGTVTRYSWSFIKNKAKGKKEGDTSHMFEDFKFEENNEKL
jgi:hypothetical protein